MFYAKKFKIMHLWNLKCEMQPFLLHCDLTLFQGTFFIEVNLWYVEYRVVHFFVIITQKDLNAKSYCFISNTLMSVCKYFKSFLFVYWTLMFIKLFLLNFWKHVCRLLFNSNIPKLVL